MLGLVKCALGVMFVIVLVVDCSSISEECTRVNGVDYRGTQQKSSSGRLCLNWNNTSRNYDTTHHNDADTGIGNHNFCRNPDGSEKLWCYVSGADGVVQRESCAVDSCQDQDSTEAAATPTTEPSSGTTDTTELVKSILVPAKGAVVQPVMGVSQRVRTGPKKKKDLGTLGYVLAIVMMAIIIVLGVGITVGYFYKRGRDLKRQHEQRVYEREMHRITLPLSAFANPTCELIDENAIVVSGESAEQMPPQGTGEGSDPLIGQAGTPGA